MKKIIPALALLLFIAAVVSCKKDNQPGIVGKWALTEVDTINTNGTTNFNNLVQYPTSPGYAQFNADGTGYSSILTTVVYATGATVQKGFDEIAGDFTYRLEGNGGLSISYKQKNARFPVIGSVGFNGDEMVFTRTTTGWFFKQHYKKIK